ncbi:hypothetical protein IQ07DRAFT_14129 [Pyrenochaeta sp. DS3sAY3a]|nr:hypothetical protein IQ07DRAFT_14129 [Pyrenochaeta sp. DS3sAY3a]
MTEIMAQQTLGLSAPASRQDIVSALLNDYGNSFGRGETSPLTYSPVPALKELPPPPPREDSLRNKPLPAVQRMSMKFQLREHEDLLSSPEGSPTDSQGKQPRRRIMSRSLSRESKPASLKLTVSNGSTATIPPTPAFPVQAPMLPSSPPFEDKELPPPPPEKSVRRKSVKQPDMGSQLSKELARNDSLLSQSNNKTDGRLPSETVDAPPVVKRKALPGGTLKKFKSLAELGNGPRGGKGGPAPPTSAPRKASVDSQASNNSQSDSSSITLRGGVAQQEETSRQEPVVNKLPPTPDEDKNITTPAPAPPRKVFTGVGLPSNPRSKAPASPLHQRGKSSTGFNILKAHRPAPPIPSVTVNTITPEMTPSPTLQPDETRLDLEISPVSPLPPPSEQRRPFSFEGLRKPVDAQPARPTTASATTAPRGPAPVQTQAQAPAPAPVSLAQVLRPLRTTSLDPPDQQNPSPRSTTAPAPMASISSQLQASPPASPLIEEQAEQAPLPTPPPFTPLPFTPLTRLPIPLPPSFIPAIAPAHLHCYTNHATTIWSNNSFQPMGCMVCRENSRDRKWACTWCQLRICRECSEELNMVPGRRLEVLLRGKGVEVGGLEREREREGGNPDIVVSEAVGEYEARFR